MLDKEKIRLMTKLAAYEQGEGKEYLPISRFYRRDYVVKQMIKSFFYSTIAFSILLLLKMLYGAETWNDTMYQIDYQAYAIRVLVMYVIFVLVYQAIVWVVYSIRYRKGQKKLKQYHNRLKKLKKMYEKEETLSPTESKEQKF